MQEQKKDFARRYLDAVHSGDAARMRELMHPDHSLHFALAPGPLGRDEHVAMSSDAFSRALADVKYELHDEICEGDKVVARGTLRCRHVDTWNGLPATGNPVEVTFIDIIHIVDGTVLEEWYEMDTLKLMKDLGAG